MSNKSGTRREKKHVMLYKSQGAGELLQEYPETILLATHDRRLIQRYGGCPFTG